MIETYTRPMPKPTQDEEIARLETLVEGLRGYVEKQRAILERAYHATKKRKAAYEARIQELEDQVAYLRKRGHT
jgi:hypothetical protein